MDASAVTLISDCSVKPKCTPEESEQPYYLSAWDISLLFVHYNQKGLLFAKPPEADREPDFMLVLLERLKESLSLTLVHFYTLAGRLVIKTADESGNYSVFVDCNKGTGTRFVHAAVDMRVSDIVSPNYVPEIVQWFFDHYGALNLDGQTLPLLSIQVTELLDGVFIGVSANHCLVDGTSFWHFINSWSEIFQAQRPELNSVELSRHPLLKTWFPNGSRPLVKIPLEVAEQSMGKFQQGQLKWRFFSFSPDSIARLKARANKECDDNGISSLQSLLALVWRCITRARNIPPHESTKCIVIANTRSRLQPPLSPDYFGNALYMIQVEAKAGEVLEHDLGWTAGKLHQAVVNLTDELVREWVKKWVSCPFYPGLQQVADPTVVQMGSSPRFDAFGNEFGMGKPIVVRSGYANKFDGKLTIFPGREGGGSIDLEVCLQPKFMEAIEGDKEFMSAAS